MNRGDYWLAVISHARPNNVLRMSKLIGDATWYVGSDTREAWAYGQMGAPSVVNSGALCDSRNAALDDAFNAGLPCVQVSDDLMRLRRATSARTKVPVSFEQIVRQLFISSKMLDARLAGVAPTDNAFYFDPKRLTSATAFIVGDLFLAQPCALRFDTALPLKEDYDYTLQHLRAFGRVARRNDLLATFAHRTNAGGAVSVRTADLEQEAITYLKQKWGSAISDHPRRQHEVLLRWNPYGAG